MAMFIASFSSIYTRHDLLRNAVAKKEMGIYKTSFIKNALLGSLVKWNISVLAFHHLLFRLDSKFARQGLGK